MKTRRNLIQLCLLAALVLPALNGGAQPVTQIAAGGDHTLFVKSDGSLWGMGQNNTGALGNSFSGNPPWQIISNNVTQVTAGGGFTLFLKSDGSLWAMGGNNLGQLGDGTYNSTNQPELILSNNVTMVGAAGYTSLGEGSDEHSLIVKSDGSLWGTGDNYSGELGLGPVNKTNMPAQIVASNVTMIATGPACTLFLKTDGSLWGTGTLGVGNNTSTNLPEQILASNVVSAAAGGIHSLFLKCDGSLWAMGFNLYGQLGDGTYNNTNLPEMIVASNVVAIAAGYYHSLFLKTDGSLWAMGLNSYGQLGDGTFNNTNRPEMIVGSNVVAIASGGGASDSFFIKSDGSLWGMGQNQSGQLGDGTTLNTNRPQQIVVNPFFNQITGQLLGTGDVQLTFTGIAGNNYALDAATSLAPPNWIPQATNTAGTYGALLFTNTPDPTTNHFWRIRSVP